MDKNTFCPLLQKMIARLSGWLIKQLSFVGRIIVAKSVLSSLPVYSMAAMSLPRSTCEEADQIVKSFIWGSSPLGRQMHLVNWGEVCEEKKVGGLGVKNMTHLNNALLGMLSWRFLNQSNRLWASEVQNVVVKGAKWALGNGRSIHFWMDPWLLDQNLYMVAISPILEGIKGSMGLIGSYSDWPSLFATALWWLWKWRNSRVFKADDFHVARVALAVGSAAASSVLRCHSHLCSIKFQLNRLRLLRSNARDEADGGGGGLHVAEVGVHLTTAKLKIGRRFRTTSEQSNNTDKNSAKIWSGSHNQQQKLK
ncbi:hypothetical protein V2J09_010467 [Rumex salicifolius]